MELALGHSKKIITKSENKTKIIQRRGIWTTTEIKKGEKFTKDNLDVLRPCVGLPASDFSKLLWDNPDAEKATSQRMPLR